jgi:hypothetical protein
METREISKSQWVSALDQFSRTHRGQRVSVESAGKDFGVQANARNLPLMGVTAETHSPGPPEIQVMVGDSPDAYIDHVIRRPAKVQIAEWNDDASATLRIQSEDGTVTLIQADPAKALLPPAFVSDEIELAKCPIA